MTWLLCPKCFRPVNPIGEHGWECVGCNVAGVINRPISPEQEEFMERKEDGQVKKVVGITKACDPEYAIIKALKWAYNFKQRRKPC